MRRVQRDVVVASALLGLAGLALAGSFRLVDRQVLRRAEVRALETFLDRAALPAERLVLAQPAEAFYPLVPGFELASRRLVLVSKYTATFPLYLLQGQPEIYLLRDLAAPPHRLNLADLPMAEVSRSERYLLARVPLGLRSWADDFDRFEVVRVDTAGETPATRDGEAYAYGPQRWDRLARTQCLVEKLEHASLSLHPGPGFRIRITSALNPGDRLVQLHLAGRDSGDRKKENRYALTVRTLDDAGRERSRQVRSIAGPQLAHWESVELPVAGGTRLEVELGVNRNGRHHLCLMGDLLR